MAVSRINKIRLSLLLAIISLGVSVVLVNMSNRAVEYRLYVLYWVASLAVFWFVPAALLYVFALSTNSRDANAVGGRPANQEAASASNGDACVPPCKNDRGGAVASQVKRGDSLVRVEHAAIVAILLFMMIYGIWIIVDNSPMSGVSDLNARNRDTWKKADP